MSDSATLWTVAWWAPLSMGFSRQEYWSGLPFTPPGNLPHLGINRCLLSLLHWQAASFPLVPPGNLIKPTHLKQLWWVQDLPTKALIPCCKESHSFQRIVHSPDGTQIEGPGTNWLQEGSTGDGELEISDVLKWDRFYSYCFPLEPVQCKPLDVSIWVSVFPWCIPTLHILTTSVWLNEYLYAQTAKACVSFFLNLLFKKYACVLSCFSCVWLSATLWTEAHQVPLSLRFSRQEYWSGLPCPPPGDLPDPGIEPTSLMSPALAGGFFYH